MKEGVQDIRTDWCKEADKHSAFSVHLNPDECITLSWGHKDADVMNRAEFSGPCAVALIIDCFCGRRNLGRRSMSELDLSNCVEYYGKVYCVKEDGTLAILQIKDIEPQDCPNCVIQALYKKLIEKK